MTAHPEITIVVTAYNVAAYLPATLQSVMDQSFQRWEMIIVDDGSEKDETPALIDAWAQRDARIKAVHLKNGGVSRARNHGLRLSSPATPYVMFLDGDDVLTDGALEKLLLALKTHPEVSAVHGRARLIDMHGKPFDDGRRDRRLMLQNGVAVQAPASAYSDFSMLVVENCVSAPGLLLARKDAVLAIGGFDEALKSAEDYDCWFRLVRGSRFLALEATTLLYRRHPGSKSKRTFLVRTNLARLKRKWLKITSGAERESVVRGYIACVRFYARERLASARRASAQPEGGRARALLQSAAWFGFAHAPWVPRCLFHAKIWYYDRQRSTASA